MQHKKPKPKNTTLYNKTALIAREFERKLIFILRYDIQFNTVSLGFFYKSKIVLEELRNMGKN